MRYKKIKLPRNSITTIQILTLLNPGRQKPNLVAMTEWVATGKQFPTPQPTLIIIVVMHFKKPWLRVKLVDFDFSAKSSSTDYNESNKPNPKCLAHTGSK